MVVAWKADLSGWLGTAWKADLNWKL